MTGKYAHIQRNMHTFHNSIKRYEIFICSFVYGPLRAEPVGRD